jgi:hypothetical protein
MCGEPVEVEGRLPDKHEYCPRCWAETIEVTLYGDGNVQAATGGEHTACDAR